MAAPSHSSSAGGTLAAHYHVFLSFRAPDTRDSFTDCLYRELRGAATPHIFRDKEEIHGGEDIDSTLIQAIEGSDISIPIISPDYAGSKFCLVELAHISLSRQTKGHVVIPIFYHVEPQILGGFPEALQNRLRQSPSLPRNVRDQEGIIGRWTDALSDLAREPPKYYDVPRDRDRPWTEVFSQVVSDVKEHLRRYDLQVPKILVGIDHHLKEMMRKLGVDCRNGGAVELLEGEEVRVVAITGLRGTGKTTLAKVVYNKIQHLFESSSCLDQIHERLQSPEHRDQRLTCFQEKLIRELNRRPYNYENYDRAISDLQSLFRSTRVLLILDDVRDKEDIEGLAAECDWFGPKSRIIVTSNMKHLRADLIERAQEHVVEEMGDEFALELFREHAYGQNPPQDFFECEPLAKKIVRFAKGIPSAIVKQGTDLKGSSIEKWKDTLDILEKRPHNLFGESLEESYKLLRKNPQDLRENRQDLAQNQEDDDIQQIFLDIACFFTGTDKNVSQYMWNARRFPTSIAFERLCNLFWVKINENEELWIHDQLQDFGKEKVRQEHQDCWMRSRLWDPSEAKSALDNQRDHRRVQALGLNCDRHEVSLTYANFAGLPNLVFLKLGKAAIKEDSNRTPWRPILCLKPVKAKKPLSRLIWLQWQGCSTSNRLSFVNLGELVILDLSESEVNHQWNAWKQIMKAEKLKVLKLTGCKVLKEFPDLGDDMNLERLILDCCLKLHKIDSITKLKKLKYLNLKSCKCVGNLPDLSQMSELEELLVDDTVITKFHPDQHDVQDFLKKLKILSARCKTLQGLPDSIRKLKSLAKLALDGAVEIERLPDSITSLTKLEVLSMRGCEKITSLPDSIGNMKSLEKLELSETSITGLPSSVRNLKNLKVLKMCRTYFKKFPEEVLNLEKLEVMDLRRCAMLKGEIPTNINNLSSLRVLGLSYTQISNLPGSITELFHLQFLELCECPNLGRESIPRNLNGEVRQCLTATGNHRDHEEFERYEQLGNVCNCIA